MVKLTVGVFHCVHPGFLECQEQCLLTRLGLVVISCLVLEGLQNTKHV